MKQFPELLPANSLTDARRRFLRSSVLGTILAMIPFLAAVTAMKPSLFRTARPDGFFSNFFDLQARALLAGRFDLPSGALNIESFIFEGRTYTYFPPFPAFLRIPLLSVTRSLDGELTVLSMIAAWTLMMVGTACLVWQLRKLAGNEFINSRRSEFFNVLFMISVGGGSTVVFLGALPWVYHEVYMWSIASSILAAWCALRLLEFPSWQRSVDLTIFATICILTRTTVGFGCVVMALGCAVVLRKKTNASGNPAWLTAFVPACVALFFACLVTWIKFGSPLNFLPLGSQVWTEVNEQRQRALAANGGGLTNFKFSLTTIPAYFDPRNIRFVNWFPYITLPGGPPKIFGSAVFDQTYRTGSVTAFMPSLCLLSCAGVTQLLRKGRSVTMKSACVPLIGAAVSVLGILNYGYIANRYVGDIMPLLIIGGAIGLVSIQTWKIKPFLVVSASVLISITTIWGMASNGLVAVSASAQISQGNSLRSFVNRQLNWPRGSSDFIKSTETIPESSVGEEVVVLGDCRALLFGSGESSTPWYVIGGTSYSGILERRSRTVQLLDFRTSKDGSVKVSVEFSEVYGARIVSSGFLERVSDWEETSGDRSLPFRVRLDFLNEDWLIEAGESMLLRIPILTVNEKWQILYITPSEISINPRIFWNQPERDDLCEKALSTAGK